MRISVDLSEDAATLGRWTDSARASGERRRERDGARRRARARRLALALVALGATAAGIAVSRIDERSLPPAAEPQRLASSPTLTYVRVAHPPPTPARRPPPVPSRSDVAQARALAADRQGAVSFAVVDSRGKVFDAMGDRRYVTASVVKSMLLIAELDRLHAAGLPLDGATRAQLDAMITYSDNDAADAVYSRVGDEGLLGVAQRAGLERFSVAGYWANAQLTARDMAVLMSRLDQLLPAPYAEYGSTALTKIVPTQRWGIPSALAGEGWVIRFKGGWRGTESGQLVHQIAHLRRGEREVSLAVLTDGNPTMRYGIETVGAVAAALLRKRGAGG